MLNIEPLQITILPAGTMEAFRQATGKPVGRINPNPADVTQIKKIASKSRSESNEKEGKAV